MLGQHNPIQTGPFNRFGNESIGTANIGHHHMMENGGEGNNF